MNEYFSIFPVTIHILFIIYMVLNYNNDKILQQRIKPHFESPINWKIKPANFFHKLLYRYEQSGTLIIIVFSVAIGVNFKWYFALIFLAEGTIISGLITGIIKVLLLQIFNSGNYFFQFQMAIFKTRILTILIDAYLFYNLYKIVF